MSGAASTAERHYRDVVARIMRAALDAVDPEKALLNAVHRDGSRLQVGERQYDLSAIDRVILIGGGKAGAPMAKAATQVVGDRLARCVVNVKEGYTLSAADLAATQAAAACPVTFVEAGHPTPTAAGVNGALAMAEAISGLTERDLVLCVISGGGSALMTLPVAGVALADVQALTGQLLRSGATINEMNTVRKHLDRLKGGNLAKLARPAHLVAAILSDVVGNPLDVIASGPTVPDTTTFADAWDVLARYDLLDSAPAAIVAHLQSGVAGRIADTPKPGDAAFARTQTVVVGSNDIAATAAVEQARREGLSATLLTTYVEGEAREVARVAAAFAKDMAANDRPLAKPACLVLGGETTVTIRGSGMGGRNQELALAGAIALSGWPDVMLATLATDGSDGPTDAAGGVVTGQSVARARALGLDPLASLRDNDSYHLLTQTGEILITGPTNTNVNDLLFVLAY
jgi:glycerate 2-kinase